MSLLNPIVELNPKLIGVEGTRLLRDQLAIGRPRRNRVTVAQISQQDDQGTAEVYVKAQSRLEFRVD
ncbi:hypothetical protein [Heyndrickxia acidicola]|uniref:Uncharacterized protein n=1 Tax=Heyndrickxia acidicola TaxID=209389 RepID=A0ABU6MEH2_9BACI|nr:hypothetical protein [Heyndrickxia acidicola]MED1202895.1 hypothetical protein [Heyndrickxia acidicola]